MWKLGLLTWLMDSFANYWIITLVRTQKLLLQDSWQVCRGVVPKMDFPILVLMHNDVRVKDWAGLGLETLD